MRHPVIKTLLVGIALSLATYAFDFLPAFTFHNSLYRVLLAGILVFWLTRLEMTDVLRFSWQSFLAGLLCGGFLLLFSLYVLTMNLLAVEARLSIELAESIGSALMIGVLEELIWRGALMGVLLRRKGRAAHGPLPAVLLSSLVFGLGHYCNLIYSASFPATTLQVFAAICMGVLLAAIYLRCKNIWVCAFLHALWNFGNWVGTQIFAPPPPAVFPEAVPAVFGAAQMLGGMIEPIILLLLGLFLLRKMIWQKKRTQTLEAP